MTKRCALVACATIFCLSFSLPVMASDSVEYSDQYFSFSYIPEKNMDIYEAINSKVGRELFVSDSRSTLSDKDYVYLHLLPISDEKYPDSVFVTGEPVSGDVIEISEDMKEVTVQYDDHISYLKDLSTDEFHYGLTLSVYGDCPESIIQSNMLIFDTLELKDGLDEARRAPSDSLEFERIYLNAAYSDAAEIYIQQAINIFDAYLNFDIDGNEASKRISSLKDSAETALADSEYMHDSDVYYGLMTADYYFESNNDGRIIELKQKYEDMLN